MSHSQKNTESVHLTRNRLSAVITAVVVASIAVAWVIDQHREDTAQCQKARDDYRTAALGIPRHREEGDFRVPDTGRLSVNTSGARLSLNRSDEESQGLPDEVDFAVMEKVKRALAKLRAACGET